MKRRALFLKFLYKRCLKIIKKSNYDNKYNAALRYSLVENVNIPASSIYKVCKLPWIIETGIFYREDIPRLEKIINNKIKWIYDERTKIKLFNFDEEIYMSITKSWEKK